jgi:hypothetical protein
MSDNPSDKMSDILAELHLWLRTAELRPCEFDPDPSGVLETFKKAADELEADLARLKTAEAAMRESCAKVADQAYEDALKSPHLHQCRDAVTGCAAVIAATIRALPLEGGEMSDAEGILQMQSTGRWAVQGGIPSKSRAANCFASKSAAS